MRSRKNALPLDAKVRPSLRDEWQRTLDRSLKATATIMKSLRECRCSGLTTPTVGSLISQTMPKLRETSDKDMPALTAFSGIAAKKAVETLASDLYSLAKEGLNIQLKRWRTDRNIDTLYRKLKQVR